MRNKEWTSHRSCWHNMGSSTLGSKGRELVVPRNSRMTLQKGEVANIKGHDAEEKITTELCRKLCQDSKKEESRENNSQYPRTTTIEGTWIQRDSNFASLRGLDSHLIL